MERDKTRAKKIQEYYDLSCNYLESAKISLKNELFEPAMFSAIHALELSLKAALLTKTDDAWKTHNIGGQFGKHFKDDVGEEACKRINVILSKYLVLLPLVFVGSFSQNVPRNRFYFFLKLI